MSAYYMPDTPLDSRDMSGEYNHKILEPEVNLEIT